MFTNKAAFLLVVLVLFIVTPARAANFDWDGGSLANDNWTTGVNWVGDVAPPNAYPLGFGDAARFSSTDAQASSATINNIVEANRAIGVLRYFPGSSLLWQNTQIDSGVTLLVGGSDGTRTFGVGAAIAGTTTDQVTISGDGTLFVDRSASGGTIRIGEGTTGLNSGTVDMSGLATFTASLSSTGLNGLFQIGSPSTNSGVGSSNSLPPARSPPPQSA